jgi:hypothetical protein
LQERRGWERRPLLRRLRLRSELDATRCDEGGWEDACTMTRCDGFFACDELMGWVAFGGFLCYVFGLAWDDDGIAIAQWERMTDRHVIAFHNQWNGNCFFDEYK